jgi:hypothetical protein
MARTGVSVFFVGTILLFAMSWVLAQQTAAGPIPFSISAGGATSFITENDAGPLSMGFARILRADPFTVTPEGFSILQFRANNILISETTVPASPLSLGDALYVEVEGPVNTGVAIANPNPAAATISFLIRNAGPGSPPIANGTFTVPPNSQLARFITEPPFNSPVPHVGLLVMGSSLPVAVTALRGLTNERSEFITTTLLQGRPATGIFGNVVGQRRTVVGYIPVFADGGGWTTQVVLVNPTNADFAFGKVEFLSPSGDPINVMVEGRTTSTIEIPTNAGGNILRVFTGGAGSDTQVGHIRVTAEDHSAPFNAFAILSFRREGITVSATSVPVVRPSKNVRLYVEESGDIVPQLRTSLAISNASPLPASVLLELMDLSGRPTGFSGTIVIPPLGQHARFFKEIPGFDGVARPFRGILQVSTGAPEGISVVGMRGRYNGRSDFLLSTVLSVEQGEAVPERDFAPVVEGSGYSTELVLLNSSGSSANVNLIPVSQNGFHFKSRSN